MTSLSLRKISILAISLFALLSLISVLPSIANANHSWGNYHWARTTSSFTLRLGDDLTPVWDAYLAGASADWNPSTVIDTAIVTGGTNAKKGRNTPKNCLPTAGRVEVCNATYGNNGWLGIASIWASGDHITQGTVKLNDTYFNTPTYNSPAWRRLVTCQEVAHTFGLDHQDEIFNNPNLGSCMDYTNDPAGTLANPDQLSNEHPNAHDFAQLATIYAHLDGFTTLSQTTSSTRREEAGSDVDSDGPAAWGKEVRRSANGRVSVFEQELGNGNKVIRHVFWAEDRARHL